MIAYAGREFNRLSENVRAERQMFADANRLRAEMRGKGGCDVPPASGILPALAVRRVDPVKIIRAKE